jgi:tetratricopeptide (TPR) repeat protein
LEKIPFILLSTLSVLVSYIVVQEDSILVTAEMRAFALRVANAVTTYLAYIGKMFWPVNLSIFYPFPKMIPLWKTTAAGLLLIAISVYSIQQRRHRPYIGIGWYWYLLALFPFIGQLQAGLWPAMADRWAYIPLIGLFLCVAWGGMEIASRLNLGRTPMGIITVILFSALVSRSWSQVLYWQNSITLFEHALASTTDNHVIHNNLANVLEWNGNAVEAEAHYLEALRIEPNFLMARYNLGGLFKSEGRLTEAIEQYREVLRVVPDHAPAHNNLATALINVKEIEKAIADQTKQTERPADSSAIRKQLDAANRLQDMLDEAIYHFRESQRIAPDSDITPKNIKQALSFRKKIDEVVVKLKELLQFLQKTES